MQKKQERKSKTSSRDRFIPSRLSWQVSHARAMLHARQPQGASLEQEAYHDDLSQALFGFSSRHLYEGSVLGYGKKLPAYPRFSPGYRSKALRVYDIKSSLLATNTVVADAYFNPVFYCDNGDVLYLGGNQMNRLRQGEHKPVFQQVFPGVNLVTVAQSIDRRVNYVSTNQGALFALDNFTSRTVSVKQYAADSFVYVVEPRSCHTFFIGTKKGEVQLVDLREKQKGGIRYQAPLGPQVTSLSYNGDCNIATGTNQNILRVYDIRKQTKPLWQFDEFEAAVMALSYHPANPELLAAGDGTSGQTLNVFNRDELITWRHTGAQVTGVTWCGRSIFTSHGYLDFSCQLHQLHSSNGKYELRQLATAKQHKRRILGCSTRYDRADLDSKQIVALGEGNRLSFWKVSSTAAKADKENSAFTHNTIR